MNNNSKEFIERLETERLILRKPKKEDWKQI